MTVESAVAYIKRMRADDDAARRLYDRFAPADGFVRYALVLG